MITYHMSTSLLVWLLGVPATLVCAKSAVESTCHYLPSISYIDMHMKIVHMSTSLLVCSHNGSATLARVQSAVESMSHYLPYISFINMHMIIYHIYQLASLFAEGFRYLSEDAAGCRTDEPPLIIYIIYRFTHISPYIL